MKERIRINGDAISLRHALGEDAGSPVDVFALLSTLKDLTVVFEPMSDCISGMTAKYDDINLIAINSNLSKGRQRFTAAHELCHLHFHDHFKTMICSKDLLGKKDDYEREADQFASFFLAPYEALFRFVQIDLDKAGKRLSIEDVIRIEQYFGMSHQAALVRLQTDKFITESEALLLKKDVIKTARSLGFSTELYKPTPKDYQFMTTGSYVRLAEELRTKELISSGKYEELLLDAFRADIVYGDSLPEDEYD